MDLYMTTSGRRVTPEFPSDLASWPELAKAVENARRLEREFQEASAAHSAGEAALQTAIAEDRARLADARVKGQKKLPDAKGVNEAERALEEAERQRNAADVALTSPSRRSSNTVPRTSVLPRRLSRAPASTKPRPSRRT